MNLAELKLKEVDDAIKDLKAQKARIEMGIEMLEKIRDSYALMSSPIGLKKSQKSTGFSDKDFVPTEWGKEFV